MLRRKKRYRYHLYDGNGGLDAPSIEGVETRYRWFSRHYEGKMGVHLNGQGRVPMEGDGGYRIARERVFYAQELKA